MRRTCRESSTRSLFPSPSVSPSAPSMLALALLAIAAPAVRAQEPAARQQRAATPPSFDAGTVRDLAWRNLGPANPMATVWRT